MRCEATDKCKCDLAVASEFLRNLDQKAEFFAFRAISDRKTCVPAPGIDNYVTGRKGAKVKYVEQESFKPVSKSGTLAEHAAELMALNAKGAGIYVTVNATDGEGVKGENIVRLRAVWADMDAKSRVDTSPGWPLAPSLTVETSPGNFHYYWLIDGEISKDDWKAVMARIVADYGADKNATDTARVLRLPGFYHCKAAPLMVKLVNASGHRYTAAELMKAFPPMKPKQSRAKATAKRKGKAKATDATLANVAAALDYLTDKCPDGSKETFVDNRESWVRFGIAIKRSLGEDGFPTWDAWSQRSEKYNATETRAKWDSFHVDDDGRTAADAITVASIFKLAGDAGWKGSSYRVLGALYAAYEAATKAAQSVDLRKPPTRTAALSNDDKGDVRTEPASEAYPGDKLGVLEWATSLAQERSGTEHGWSKSDLVELLGRMNKAHAVVEYNGKVLYTKQGIDQLTARPAIEFMTHENMARRYNAVSIGHDGKKVLTAFDMWETDPHRTHFEGVGLFPGSPKHPPRIPKSTLNLWSGFQCQPAKGDWRLLRDHMLKVMCDGNETHFNWWLDWVAQLIQEPQEKPGSAIVLRSAQKGTGKSTFAEVFQKMFGRHAVSLSNMEQVTGRFNVATAEAVIVVCEEMLWGGDTKGGNVMRDRITSKTTLIERKGLDPIQCKSYARYWFNANDAWTVPAGTEERRYFVLDFTFNRAKDPTYFKPLRKQLFEDGGVEAMVHELLARKIEADLYSPPETAGLLMQRRLTLDAFDRWLIHVAEHGTISRDGFNSTHQLRDSETAVPVSDVLSDVERFCDAHEAKRASAIVGRTLAELGVKRKRTSSSGNRGYVYSFPPLPEFRELVSKRLNVPVEANDDAEGSDLYTPARMSPCVDLSEISHGEAVQ